MLKAKKKRGRAITAVNAILKENAPNIHQRQFVYF